MRIIIIFLLLTGTCFADDRLSIEGSRKWSISDTSFYTQTHNGIKMSINSTSDTDFLTFYGNNYEILGRLYRDKKGVFQFEGKASESAKLFFKLLAEEYLNCKKLGVK